MKSSLLTIHILNSSEVNILCLCLIVLIAIAFDNHTTSACISISSQLVARFERVRITNDFATLRPSCIPSPQKRRNYLLTWWHRSDNAIECLRASFVSKQLLLIQINHFLTWSHRLRSLSRILNIGSRPLSRNSSLFAGFSWLGSLFQVLHLLQDHSSDSFRVEIAWRSQILNSNIVYHRILVDSPLPEWINFRHESVAVLQI